MKKIVIRLGVLSLVLAVFFAPALAMAYEFHINAMADEMKNGDADKYAEQSIASVTGTMESPSMVRDNPADPAMRDYIYIGNEKVHVFSIDRENKTILQVAHYTRANWDASVYPTSYEIVQP